MDDYTRMWMGHHASSETGFMRFGFVTNNHHQHIAHVPPIQQPPQPKPEPHHVVEKPAPVKKQPDGPKQPKELLDTDTRYKMAMADLQVTKMMRSVKHPETNQSYWQCTECDYANTSAKHSKFKVKAHVLKHHVQSGTPASSPPQPASLPSTVSDAWKNNEWTHGQTFTVNATPYNPPVPRAAPSPYDTNTWTSTTSSTEDVKVKAPIERLSSEQVAALMKTIKDPESGQTLWRCALCDYFSKNPKSSKFRVERHILKHHKVASEGGPRLSPPPTAEVAWMEGQEPLNMYTGYQHAPVAIKSSSQPVYHQPIPTQPPHRTSSTQASKTEAGKEAEKHMWSLKDPNTGRTYWQCSECEYNNKSAKSSKFKVMRHVQRVHIEGRIPRKPGKPGVAKTEAGKQAEKFMWSLKDPHTGKTFWKCIECDYFSKSKNSSKSMVMKHVVKVHIEGLMPPQPGKSTRFRSPKKELTELDRTVESLMVSLQDPTTRRTIWLCTKCNYTAAKSPISKSNSHKEKMKRHILRKHVEGEEASIELQKLTRWKHPTHSNTMRV